MKFHEFERQEGNHFVALEYYALMLNRTLMVLLTPTHVVGVKVKGMLSVESGADPTTRTVTRAMAVQDVEEPYAYVKDKYLKKVADMELIGEEILRASSGNFRIAYGDIMSVKHDPRKKWGMGYYPHDGKVYITTKTGLKKELILIGLQNGAAVAQSIENKLG